MTRLENPTPGLHTRPWKRQAAPAPRKVRGLRRLLAFLGVPAESPDPRTPHAA